MTDSNSSSLCYTIVGKLFTRYPVLILLVTISLALSLSWIGVAQNGLPAFGDPYLGFQTRFTSISNRLISLDNLRLELNRMETLENYPAERISEKEAKKKRRGLNSNSMCNDFPLEEYGRVGLEILHQNFPSISLLTRESLALICFFQQEIQAESSYDLICEFDENRHCCPMWSLPNYVAQFSNKSDCVDIQAEDVERFKEALSQCRNFYHNSTTNDDCLFRRSTCPSMCHQGQIIHSAMYYTMERVTMAENGSEYTMIILPVPKSQEEITGVMESFQKSVWKLRRSLPPEMATLVGFDFGGKNGIFETYLLSDLQYVALASVIIFGTVCIFTKSLFVTVISFGILLLSLGTSYYFYKTLFGIQYFPFMNMLVAIILLGIGTDATLIVSSAWERSTAGAKALHGKSRRETVMVETLKETTVTLFITTCTTAGAFFASLTSSITTIRCFSIFAGTALITSFLLLYVCVPIGLDVSERFWKYFKSLLPLPHLPQTKLAQKFIKFGSKFSTLSCGWSSDRLGSPRKWFSTSSAIFWTFSFVLCAGVLTASTFILFYSPGFKLADSEQFQLLSSSHPLEMFDRLVAPRFGDPESPEKLTVYLIWGLRPVDTGNGLNPKNVGGLEFDEDFSLVPPENQKWMKRLCKRIVKTSFYDLVENGRVGLNLDSCFMDTFVGWMKRDCHHLVGIGKSYKPCCNKSKFPYDNSTFNECIGLAARDVYRTPAIYFLPDIAGPKFFRDRGHGVTREDGTLATFAVRIRTNVTSSLIFDKMDKVYKDLERSFHEILQDAPEGLKNGFFVSSHFDFYDLQKSLMEETWTSLLLSIGLCFFFLLISSRSFTIASGAVLSILAIVLVTAGVLIQFFNWKLGVFESVAVTVAVGLSDFTAHHSIEFAKERTVTNMTGPTFFSAVSTVVMGLSMFLFSSVLVYQQIGSFFVVLVVTSWIYSVFFLSPVLMVLGTAAGMRASAVKFILCPGVTTDEHKGSSDNNEDATSHSDLILENVNVTRRVPEKKPNMMMEKWKQLKKLRQETPV